MNMEGQAIYVLVICTFGLIFCEDYGTNTNHQYYYDGSGEVKISCNKSDIINVTNIQLTNHPTDCTRDTCNLTDNDINLIESCNGNSVCAISIDDMNPCINDKGLFDVDYTCQGNVFSCDFEADKCDWFFELNDWTIANPLDYYLYKDHTTGSGEGHFMYTYVKTDNKIDFNPRFRSKPIHGSTKQCLTFYYNIRFADELVLLYIRHVNGTDIQIVNITRPANGNIWNSMRLSIKDVSGYRIIIEGRSKHKWSVFAVDDISIINRDCEEITECDFESGECNWIRSYHWYREKGDTASLYTGPSTDHTTTDNGYYVYMEASEMTNWKSSRLISPTFNGTGKMCFSFWYYMYGRHMGSLRVYIAPDSGKTSELFSISGNRGKLWHAAHIDIHVYGKFVIIIQGQRGRKSKSDIAVDDISLFSGNCKGIVKHKQNCRRVDEKVEFNECSNHYLSNIHVNLDPSTDLCKDFLDKNANFICNNSSYTVFCDFVYISRQRPSCFNLNDLLIEYTCTDIDEFSTNNIKNLGNDNYTDVLVGATIGILLVLIAILCVVFIIYSHINQNRNETRHSNNQQQERQQTFPDHSVNSLSLDLATLDNAEGYTSTVTTSEQHEYQELTSQNVDHNPHNYYYNVLDQGNIEQHVYDEVASTNNSQGDYYNVL